MILDAVIGILRVVFGLILVLFLPGYFITGALYPGKEDLPFMERLAYSFVLSIASVMLSVLFIDIVLGVDTTPLNIVVTLLIVTGLAGTIWNFELYLRRRKPKKIERPLLVKKIRDRVQSLLQSMRVILKHKIHRG